MADWSLQGDGQDYLALDRPVASTWGIAATGSGTIHTKGSWAALTTNTLDAGLVLIHLHGVASHTGTPGTAMKVLADIGIGSPSSEVVLVNNLLWIQASALDTQDVVATAAFPILLPASTILSLRCQSNTGEPITFKASATTLAHGFGQSSGGSEVETWGADTAATDGVNVTPGSGAWGSYAELMTITGIKADLLVLAFGIPGSYPSANTTHNYLVDVAVGSAGNEVTVIPAIPLTFNENGLALPAFTVPLPVSIPAGSRVSVRAATNTGGPNFSCVAYAIGG